MPSSRSERPPDGDFQQQNLKAWQPLLTPNWVIGTFFVIAVLFIPIGILVLYLSESVVEVSQRYDHNTKFNGLSVVTLNIEHDMIPPIFFYYKLTNFFQNHRRYVKSRADGQLRGDLSASTSSCDPLESWESKTLYPCGLIANSYFNDTFSGPVVVRDNTEFNLTWTDKDISWRTDRDKFASAELPDTGYTRTGPGGFELPDPTQEDFVVWMRTAGLPTFKKLRYRILDQTLKAGDQVRIEVLNTFPVQEFHGEKAVVLSTASYLGGKNNFLGYAYISVGGLCLVLSLAFCVKKLKSPRELGDISYFNMGRANENHGD